MNSVDMSPLIRAMIPKIDEKYCNYTLYIDFRKYTIPHQKWVSIQKTNDKEQLFKPCIINLDLEKKYSDLYVALLSVDNAVITETEYICELADMIPFMKIIRHWIDNFLPNIGLRNLELAVIRHINQLDNIIVDLTSDNIYQCINAYRQILPNKAKMLKCIRTWISANQHCATVSTVATTDVDLVNIIKMDIKETCPLYGKLHGGCEWNHQLIDSIKHMSKPFHDVLYTGIKSVL